MAAPEDLVSEQRLRESFIKHAARAQLHRGCDDRVSPEAIQQGAFEIAGDRVDYAIDLGHGETWRGTLRRGPACLPESIADDAGQKTPMAGAEHRVRSAIHYFIALVENPARDPEPFLELLGDRFSLHYTVPPLRGVAAVRDWVTGKLASVVASEHDIHTIDCRADADGSYGAVVTMKSQALFPDGSGAISRNTQHWTLRDDPAERFPRITEILIDRDAVEFFGPAPDYAPRAMPG